MINAVKEVTRKNAESYLEDKHIEHIVSAYKIYACEDNYAFIASVDEIAERNYSLNISLYTQNSLDSENKLSFDECVDRWNAQSIVVDAETQKVLSFLMDNES